MSPASHDYEFDDRPVQGREDSDVAFVGRTVADQPADDTDGLSGSVFCDTDTETLFSGDIDRDGEQIAPVSGGNSTSRQARRSNASARRRAGSLSRRSPVNTSKTRSNGSGATPGPAPAVCR